jgi:hypothetical protein
VGALAQRRSLWPTCLALAVLCASGSAAAASPPASARAPGLLGEAASGDAHRLAAWAIATGDHGGMPFLLVDKVEAKVFAFDPQGRLLGVTPALLGLGRGDESPAGIGDRKLSTMSPAERVTPAGRFVAALGENLGGKEILWVDYEAAISLHRVDTETRAERRLQRLATPSAADNRISYGCINVPVAFYETIVGPLFRGRVGVVYILPEVRSVEEVFFTPAVLLARSAASPARPED